jgi:uncharacterized protein
MNDVSSILHNQLLMSSLGACLLAQVLKGVVDVVRFRKLNIRAVVGSGGMPSSHSALVSALATGIGLSVGWESLEFAVATIFAIIVMYDAAGVRQAAGKQAKILNQIIEELFQEEHKLSQERLKELLGHTPVQVLVGLALGITVALVCYAPPGRLQALVFWS